MTKVFSFQKKDIPNKEYIQSFSAVLNPEDNGGEQVAIIVDLYNNGDGPAGYWNNIQIETVCYGVHSSSINLFSAANLKQFKEVVDALYEAQLKAENHPFE